MNHLMDSIFLVANIWRNMMAYYLSKCARHPFRDFRALWPVWRVFLMTGSFVEETIRAFANKI